MTASEPPLLLLLLLLALVCSPPCLAATERETKAFSSAKAFNEASATTTTPPLVKSSCGYPTLQRCMKAAKADMKAYTSQTCIAVLKGGPPKRRARAQREDQDEEAWRRELEELVATLGNDEPLNSDDIDVSKASTLTNFPQQPPNSTLEEQMALVRNLLEKGESGNVTCADFTEFFDRTVQTFTYGMGNFAVTIGRLLGQGAALALGTSNGQSIGDVAGPGMGSVAGDLVFRAFLNAAGVPPGARTRGRRAQQSDTLNYMGVNGLGYSAGAGIGLGTGYAIGVPVGVAAGRQRGTEIGVAFTIWLAQTANFWTRYSTALLLANTQMSMGIIGSNLDFSIDQVEEYMLSSWKADDARLLAGNFSSFELNIINAWRKTGALGGFVAGQAIGPAIGETSGAIYGVLGSAIGTAAVNAARAYLAASNNNTTSSSSQPTWRLLESLVGGSVKPEAVQAILEAIFDTEEEGQSESTQRRKAQSLAARSGMTPAMIAAMGMFAGDFTNTAPLLTNAIAGWAATSIAIGVSAGIGAGVANGVAWGIGREIGHGFATYLVDFIGDLLADAQFTLEPYIQNINTLAWLLYGVDTQFSFVPACDFSTYDYTERDVSYYDHSKWDKPIGKSAAGNVTEAGSLLSYDEYTSSVPWAGSFTTSDLDAWAANNTMAEIASVFESGTATSPSDQEQQLQEMQAYVTQILEDMKGQEQGFTRTAESFQGLSSNRQRNFVKCKNYAMSEMYRRASLCYSSC